MWTRQGARLAVVLALALPSPVAEGRPGGGENYVAPAPSPRPSPSPQPSSGGSYRSPSGSSGSGGSLADNLIGMAIAVAGLGALFAFFAVSEHVKGLAARSSPPDDGPPPPRVIHPDAERSLARARAVFNGVYAAWNHGDADALRQWTSDGVYSRFSTLLAIQARAGFRNETLVKGAPRAALMALVPGPVWDRADVRFGVDAVDRDVEPGGDVRREESSRFVEIWTFLRRHREGSGPAIAASGACPACGALLPDGATPRCGSCGAVSNSGEHDWVLTEITQPGAPRQPELRPPADVVQRHPDLSPPVLEDRASAAFWAWIDAGLRDSITPLAPFLAPDADIQLVATESAAVGAVDVVSVTARGEGLLAQVDVAWSSAGQGRKSRMVLRTDATPRPPSLATLSCGSCAGPLDRSDAPSCRWCGADRAPAPAEWAVVSIRS